MVPKTMASLALGVLAFVAMLTFSKVAAAGPPDHYADLVVEDVALMDVGGSCVAEVNWSGLKGGKPLWIKVRLAFFNGSTYQTSFADNAHEVYRVKQNDNLLVVDFGPTPVDSSDHQVSVTFMDRRGNILRGPQFDYASCG